MSPFSVLKIRVPYLFTWWKIKKWLHLERIKILDLKRHHAPLFFSYKLVTAYGYAYAKVTCMATRRRIIQHFLASVSVPRTKFQKNDENLAIDGRYMIMKYTILKCTRIKYNTSLILYYQINVTPNVPDWPQGFFSN